MRIRCWLTGCDTGMYSDCHRCGTDAYEWDFYQFGKLEPLFRLYRRSIRLAQKVTGKRCTVCGKRYWRGYDEYTCSDQCFSDWLPF